MGMNKFWGLTSIKPKNERLWIRILSGLNEPIEEGPPRIFIDIDVPSIVSKAQVKALPWEP